MDRDTLELVRRDMSDRTNWRSQIELDDIIALCDFAEKHMDPPSREPVGCPTPGACSCPGYQSVANESADLVETMVRAIKDSDAFVEDTIYPYKRELYT